MKFFDDKCKQTTKWNRNYFYLGTISIILICVILLWKLGFRWHYDLYQEGVRYTGDKVNLLNILSPMFSALDHSSWKHLLGNSINFLIMGIYLERKMGTFKFLNLCIIFMFFSTSFASHIKGNIYHQGLSGVNWSIYSFIIIDFIFSLSKEKRNLINILLGIAVILYMYVSHMSWSGTENIFYPESLINHSGHFVGFIAGILIGLFYQILSHKPKNKIEQ